MTVQELCNWVDKNGSHVNRNADKVLRLLKAADAVVEACCNEETASEDANEILANILDAKAEYDNAKREEGLE